MQPTPFILRERFATIDCDLPGYEGLQVQVRMNLTNGERLVLREIMQEMDDESGDLSDAYHEKVDQIDAELASLDTLAEKPTPEEKKRRRELTRKRAQLWDTFLDDLNVLGERRRNLIAPHVKDWNLYLPADDGEEPPKLSPPCVDPASLNEVDSNVVVWLVQSILNAYTGGAGFSKGFGKSDAAPEPGNEQSSGGPKVIDTPSIRPSRKKSSSQNKSMSAG